MKRKRRATKALKTVLGRVMRDIERKLHTVSATARSALGAELALARRLCAQKRDSKNKLYALHAPEVECLSKGKAHKRWEFGVKASFAVTNKEGLVIGARSFPGNPYDGHTLAEQLEQVAIISDVKPTHCYVDKGYRGHGVEDVAVYLSGQRRGVNTRRLKRELKRRSAIEASIGHMKNDGSLNRCWLKGATGDAMHVLLCACGQNIRLLLRYLQRFLRQILDALLHCFTVVATPWLDNDPAAACSNLIVQGRRVKEMPVESAFPRLRYVVDRSFRRQPVLGRAAHTA